MRRLLFSGLILGIALVPTGGPSSAQAPPPGPVALVAAPPPPASVLAGASRGEVRFAVPRQARPFPGGILDPGGRTAYLAGAGEGIEAIDLTTGEVVWQTHEAQIPILVLGNRLLAQAGVKRNRLRVLTFDLERKGECIAESDPVVLPAWVVTGEAPGRSFSAVWKQDKHYLTLDWEATAWSDGLKSSTHRQPSTRKHAVGSARIDLEGGEVELQVLEKLPQSAEAPLPRFLEKQAVRWHKVIDHYLAALILEEAPDTGKPAGKETSPGERKYRFVLRAWDRVTGKPIPEVEVLTGRRLVVLPTLDEAFLLVRDAAPDPGELVSSATDKEKDWYVFPLDALTLRGRVPWVPGTQSALLFAGRAYFLVAGPVTGPLDRPGVRSQSVQAFDLVRGKKLWERPVAGRSITPPSR
jgi:hypothetical protein